MSGTCDRMTRVRALLKRAIADDLQRTFGNGPVLVSVTEVTASSDLREGTVSVSLFGGTGADRDRAFDAVCRHRTELQHRIARELGFKHTPVLRFRKDERLEKGDRVLELLNHPEGQHE